MDKQTITGNGGTSYTLTHAVANAQEIEVFVNNVRQEAGVAYTVSGTALTMTGNVASSDSFYVIYQGKALQSVVPPDGSVTSAKLDTNIDIAGTLDVTGVLTADAGLTLPSGQGINFSATGNGSGTVTTEVLTDFEQGTWTPTSAYGTVTSNYAHYIKIGKMVTIWTQLQSFSDSSGNALYVEGLPYASASDFAGTGVCMHRYVTLNSDEDLVTYIAPGASNFRIFVVESSTGWATLTYSLLSTSHQFYINFSYLTG